MTAEEIKMVRDLIGQLMVDAMTLRGCALDEADGGIKRRLYAQADRVEAMAVTASRSLPLEPMEPFA